MFSKVQRALLTALFVGLWDSETKLPAATIHVPKDEPTIQRAIDAATDGDEVLVAPGTYFENINFNGKAITVISETGPSATIIDGGHLADVVGFGSGEGPTSVLAGFTVRNGFSEAGGGVFALLTSPTIISNIFEGNISESGGFGAAIAGFSASPIIEANIFRFNSGDDQYHSGVVSFVNDSSPLIANNIFVSNACRAINLTLPDEARPLVLNNTFVANSGAIRVNGNWQIYKNNILVGNKTGVEFARATVAGWTHNLVFGNGVDYIGIEDQTGKNYNISADPLFECPEKADFKLLRGSPCIDAGDNDVTNILMVDFVGNPRSVDGDDDCNAVADIGAFEFQRTPLGIRIEIDSTGFFNPKTGVATVRGTVSTTRPANVELTGAVLQATGHGKVTSGWSFVSISESGNARWEISTHSPDQRFRGGPAVVGVAAEAFEVGVCQTAFVQLFGAVSLRAANREGP